MWSNTGLARSRNSCCIFISWWVSRRKVVVTIHRVFAATNHTTTLRSCGLRDDRFFVSNALLQDIDSDVSWVKGTLYFFWSRMNGKRYDDNIKSHSIGTNDHIINLILCDRWLGPTIFDNTGCPLPILQDFPTVLDFLKPKKMFRVI